MISKAQNEKRFFTGRQVAWMIYEYFQVSDTDESVLDINEILNDNVQSFSRPWDETMTAMKKQLERAKNVKTVVKEGKKK